VQTSTHYQTHLRLSRIEGSVTLDGKLNEEFWKKAYPIANFTQREQTEGAAPTEQTKVDRCIQHT